MTTQPTNRQRQAGTGVPRSGGRIAGRGQPQDERDVRRTDVIEHPVDGAVALKPRLSPQLGDGLPRARRTGAAEPVVTEPGLRVAPPAPVSAPRAPFVVLVLALVVAGVVGILVLNTKINENAFVLDNLKQQQAELDLNAQRLQDDIAKKQAPGALAPAARNEGMQRPSTPPSILELPNGHPLTMPQPTAR